MPRLQRVRGVSGRTTLGKFSEIVHKMVIKDRVQRFYALAAHEKAALVKFKREHGYCGGSPSCMEYTGEETLCRHCKHQAANPKYKRPVWEYGKIRAKERETERAAKREKNEREAQRAPKKKAA
jgi:hypothetical protein